MNWNKISFNLFVSLTFLPIFFVISVNGIIFDTVGGWDKNPESFLPPLPLSQIVVIIFSILFLKNIILNRFIVLAFFVISINLYALILINSSVASRYLIISTELLNLIIAYIVFSLANKRYWASLSLKFKYHSLILLTIIIGLICLFTDFVLGLEGFNFISESLAIYNYFDYFAVLFAAVFMYAFIYMDRSKAAVISLIILFLLFNYFSVSTHSRAVLLSVYAVLLGAGFLRVIKYIFKKEVPYIFVFFLMFFMSVVYLIIASNNLFYYLDDSLQDRARMIISFFESMTFLSIFFPAIRHFELGIIDGSLHNELLEIFANFGILGIVIVYNFLFRVALNKTENYKSSVLIIFIMFMSMFQLNLFHPYSANLLMLIIAIHSSNHQLNLMVVNHE